MFLCVKSTSVMIETFKKGNWLPTVIKRGVIMDAKTVAWIQLIGAVVAGWMSWQAQDWPVLILAVVFLAMSINGLSGKKR